MPVDNRTDLVPISTVPDNLDQKPRFGAITETVKDAFLLELRHYLSTSYTQMRSGELPRIDKYSVALDVALDPLETAVSLIRNYPDIPEDLPLIAVLAATGQNMQLGISGHHTSTIVPAAKLISTVAATHELANGDTIEITTYPEGPLGAAKVSTFTFGTYMFPDITAATIDQIIVGINMQALYIVPYKVITNGVSHLALRAGNRGINFPNKITITGGTAITKLGFTQGQTDQNYGTGKVAMERHHIAANLTVGLEVVAESENVRTDVSDLLFDFFTFVMADRGFTFYGRSTFDESIQDETYQIIIKTNEVSLSGEQETPRQNDPKDKIYINRINVPVTIIQYSDRVISRNAPGSITFGVDPNIPEAS